MRRCSGGMAMPAVVSVSTCPSNSMYAESAASRPEMMLMAVVLPQPDLPNRATTPGVGTSNWASRENPSRRLRILTLSIRRDSATDQMACTARQQFRQQQADQSQHE